MQPKQLILNAVFILWLLGFILIPKFVFSVQFDPMHIKRCYCLAFDDLFARIGYTSKEGIGREHGYSTFGVFYYHKRNFPSLGPYVDLRLHYLDNKRFAGNFGFGFQKPIFTTSQLRGYAFFDFRNSSFKLFKQITAGFEWTGSYFNLTLNTYWPLNWQGRKEVVKYKFPRRFFAKEITNNHAFRGFDLDLSRYFFICDNLRFYFSSGFYYFQSNFRSTVGGKFRAEAEFYRGVVIAMQTTWDNVFRSRTYGAITLTWPLCGAAPLCYRNVPIRREEIILLKKRTQWKTNF